MNSALPNQVDRVASRDQLLRRRATRAAYRSLHRLASEAQSECRLQDAVWRGLPLILLALVVAGLGYLSLFGR